MDGWMNRLVCAREDCVDGSSKMMFMAIESRIVRESRWEEYSDWLIDWFGLQLSLFHRGSLGWLSLEGWAEVSGFSSGYRRLSQLLEALLIIRSSSDYHRLIYPNPDCKSYNDIKGSVWRQRITYTQRGRRPRLHQSEPCFNPQFVYKWVPARGFESLFVLCVLTLRARTLIQASWKYLSIPRMNIPKHPHGNFCILRLPLFFSRLTTSMPQTGLLIQQAIMKLFKVSVAPERWRGLQPPKDNSSLLCRCTTCYQPFHFSFSPSIFLSLFS